LSTDAAIRRCFGVEKAEFEKAYRAHLDRVLSGLQDLVDSKPRSLQELKQLTKDDPRNADAWAELAREYLRERDAVRARESATKSQHLKENHPLAAFVLARLELAAGDAQHAIRLLQKSLDEQSPQEDALALLAGLKMKGGESAEAERLYRLGAERYPHTDKWEKSLASVYLQTGEKRKLRDSLRRLAELDHDGWVFRKKLLELAIEAQDFEDAIRWGTEALQIDVTDAEVHALLGRALGSREKYDRAIHELQTAVELAPQEVDWRLALADVCLRAGRKEQAVQVLKELLAEYPHQEQAKQLLKRAGH
jgi:tetratricopeptide (TPR) repeat protein